MLTSRGSSSTWNRFRIFTGVPAEPERGGNLDAADVEPEGPDRGLFLDGGGPLPRYLVWVERSAVRRSMSGLPALSARVSHLLGPLPPPLNPLPLLLRVVEALYPWTSLSAVSHTGSLGARSPPHLEHFMSSATAPTSVSSTSWPYSFAL